MPQPAPITRDPADRSRRAQSVYDLEKTIVAFVTWLVSGARLDNPTLNLAQPGIVSFDPTERAQALTLKVVPRVVRGRVPRTVTGEIAIDKLPESPHIIVQAISARVDKDETVATAKLLFNAYDENPDSSGYQDVQNLCESVSMMFTSYGQMGLDNAYPIILPIEWQLVEADTFPHFIAEMTTKWMLPSARPLPDAETFGIVPAEHIDLKASYDTEPQHGLFE